MKSGLEKQAFEKHSKGHSERKLSLSEPVFFVCLISGAKLLTRTRWEMAVTLVAQIDEDERRGHQSKRYTYPLKQSFGCHS